MASIFKSPTALLLAALSGAAGLMHQTLWVRRMIDVLGADAGTFSRVIGAFFLGLALGAFGAARRATPRPWRAVACAELGVVMLAGIVLFSGQFAQGLAVSFGEVEILKWILPLFLVTPPAVAMGLVVPWMIRATPMRLEVPIYALNTLGGIVGVIVVWAWSLPSFGLFGASLVAVAFNLVVALAAWAMDRGEVVLSESVAKGSHLPWNSDLVLAFASGFLVSGAEVIFQHQFSQLLISSHFSSSFVLSLVLASLGLAALLVPLFARLGKGALSLALVCAALITAAQPFLLIVQRGGLLYLPFEKPFPLYVLTALQIGLPACALPFLIAGLVFPLLLLRAREQGIDAGWILAVNGVGGWLGAELAERLLAPVFGLWWAMGLLAAGYALCFAFHQRRWPRWAGIALMGGFIWWTWKIDGRLPYASLVPTDHLMRVSVGPEGVVSVVRGESDDWRILFNNTYTLGGSRAQMNQERQTLLPVLLHGDAKTVATIGVATGSSMAGALLDPAVEHVEGMELSPLVLRFAREYFGSFNRSIFQNPRATFTYGDARWTLARRPQQFDAIEGDLFLPWRTGESRLYSLEHFANVRQALRPNGIFCQWLPLYQLTKEEFDTIVRTFKEVFPEAWIVRGDFYTTMPIVGLIGGRSLKNIDWKQVDAACQRVKSLNQSHDPIMRHSEGVAMTVVGPLSDPDPGPVNTLANSWIEWDASRNVIGPHQAWFNGVASANYLRNILRQNDTVLPVNLRDAQNFGDLCLATEISGAANLPQTAELQQRLQVELPASLRDDPAADWSRWPMRFRPNLP